MLVVSDVFNGALNLFLLLLIMFMVSYFVFGFDGFVGSGRFDAFLAISSCISGD